MTEKNMTRKNEVVQPVDERDFQEMLGANPKRDLGKKIVTLNKYNSWPDVEKWPVLSGRFLRSDEDWENLLTVVDSARISAFRQVNSSTIPPPLAALVHRESFRSVDRTFNVRFYWEVDSRVVCYIPRDKQYKQELVGTWRHERTYPDEPFNRDSGYITTFPAIVAVIGCDHDMYGWKLGNCWHASKCQKCGYYSEVDSGD